MNTLNTERKLKDWEQCEQALEFLPPPQQGELLDGKTRWRIAIDKSGGSISEDTLYRYDRIKTFDKKTPFSIFFPQFCPQQQYDLIDRIKGIDCDKEPLTIATANALVSRYTNKEKLKQKYPDKKLVVDQIYTDLMQDFHVWQQDNRQEWLIEDESIQLVCCSPHYFNQRKYTEEEIVYDPQTLSEYLNDLLLAFTQAKKKLKKDGVLCINIADTQKHGENYMVVFRFCLDLADKLGLFYMFKQIWAKTNGLAKGREEALPVLDHEEILYFSKSKKYFFNPIKYYDLEKEITLAYYNGRTNPDASKTTAKWIVSKEYETFRQFIKQNDFAAIIETGTASAESRAITEKYGEKHPAIMPLVIPLYPILCFSRPTDIVFDPWVGTGTTLKVALATGRTARGTDLEKRFVDIANQECQDIINLFE